MDDGLQSYYGIEPSAKAAQFVSKAAGSRSHLASKVRMEFGIATDIKRLSGSFAPDLVVANSVAQ